MPRHTFTYVVQRSIRSGYRWVARVVGDSDVEWTDDPYRAKQFLSRVSAERVFDIARRTGKTDLAVVATADMPGSANAPRRNTTAVAAGASGRIRAGTKTPLTVRAAQGVVQQVRYLKYDDSENYYHDFESDRVVLFLAQLEDGQKVLLIESVDGTPLWD